MVSGELSVILETSEGETSGEDKCDGDYSDINDKPHRVVQSGEHTEQRWQAIKFKSAFSRQHFSVEDSFSLLASNSDEGDPGARKG